MSRPDSGSPISRQAVDLVCGGGSRAQDGQKPGTAEGRARNVPRSEHGVSGAEPVEAACCGALGCRETDELLRVQQDGRERVLCRSHARRFTDE